MMDQKRLVFIFLVDLENENKIKGKSADLVIFDEKLE